MSEFFELSERIAKLREEAQKIRKELTKEKYRLRWSPLMPYNPEILQAMKDDEVGSCVYELWNPNSHGRVAVYIGECKELGSRLEEHMKPEEQNKFLKKADFRRMFFSFAIVQGIKARKSMERALWRLYEYPWNSLDGPVGAGVTGQVVVEEYFSEPFSIVFNGVRTTLSQVGSIVTLP
jgi:predicted GIY-YIG superfamily endonuclease